MLDTLKFVKCSSSLKEDYAFFRIIDGRIESFNGILSISAPIDLDIDACPKADSFIKAIDACNGQISMHMTKANKLCIKSEDLTVYIPCIDDLEYINLQPYGKSITIDFDFLPVFKKLLPFVATDTHREFSKGILLKNQSAFATNNACLIEHWLPIQFPEQVCIPGPAIKELLRLNVEPKSIQIADRTITFHFDDNKWLCSQLYTSKWPDMSAILDSANSDIKPIPKDFFEKIKKLLPFSDEARIFLSDNSLSTSRHNDDGATSVCSFIKNDGKFYGKNLMLLDGIADKIDLSDHRKPCVFYGDKIRGAIIGMKY
jgi:DNA polymerase III sliding clamp (beta) subunit (PCNA family)